MISSTSSTDRTARLDLLSKADHTAKRPPAPRSDQISTEGAEFLHAELKRQPEIRPEVVERARALAANPDYPPREVLQKIAQQILSSPDLSEDES